MRHLNVTISWWGQALPWRTSLLFTKADFFSVFFFPVLLGSGTSPGDSGIAQLKPFWSFALCPPVTLGGQPTPHLVMNIPLIYRALQALNSFIHPILGTSSVWTYKSWTGLCVPHIHKDCSNIPSTLHGCSAYCTYITFHGSKLGYVRFSPQTTLSFVRKVNFFFNFVK